MENFPITGFLFLIIGLALRLYVARFESVHIRWAWDLLCRGEDSPQNGTRTTLLERAYTAMNAARLGRLVALLFLVPAGAIILQDALTAEALDLSAFSANLVVFIAIVIAASIIFAVLMGYTAYQMRDFYSTSRPSSAKDAPEWMTDQGERVPALVAAGAILWDWFVRGGEWFARGLGLQRPIAHLVEQDDELLMAVGEGEVGAISSAREQRDLTYGRTERDMIRAIQRLDQTLVREVMRPLNGVTAVALTNLTAEKFLALARRTGFTRFPCYYDQVTNLIGYLNVYDFLESPVLPKDMRKMVHGVLFVPEVARVDVALQEMLRTRSQIAICFDEFGGCSGLLSREDIIEEITGEIMDEYDRPELKIQEVRDAYVVDGTTDLDDLEEALGLELDKRNCDTIAGYIFHRLSRMPRRGEQLDEHGWKIEVLQMENHRIRKVRVTPPPDEEEDEDFQGDS